MIGNDEIIRSSYYRATDQGSYFVRVFVKIERNGRELFSLDDDYPLLMATSVADADTPSVFVPARQRTPPIVSPRI